MAKELQKITEKEIQQRLYGQYLGEGKKQNPPIPVRNRELGKEMTEGKTEVRVQNIENRKVKKEIKEQKTENVKQRKDNNSAIHLVGSFTLGIIIILAVGLLSASINQSTFPGKKLQKPSISTSRASSITDHLPYTIQVVVYENRQGALKVIESLKKKGFSAYIKENKTTSGKLQLRIYVGDFVTPEEAKPTLALLKSQHSYNESFIRKK